jgi:hypothetical protein
MTQRRDEAGSTDGVRRHLAAATVTVALLLLIAALAAVCAPASFAVVRGDGDADDKGPRLALLGTGRSVLLTAPVAHILGGALASGHRDPDGDDHDIDPNPSPAPSRQFVAVRGAGDVSAAIEVRVERCAFAFAFSTRTTSEGRATSPRAATSRGPPLSA